jgi:hypothetical protein
MTRDRHKQSYAVAKLNLLEQLRKRESLDQQIRILKRTVLALGELSGAHPEELDKLLLSEGFTVDSKLGFTEPIRWLFGISKTPPSPVEIRDDLLKMGIGGDQVNLLSSIHPVLRRMAEAGEIERTADLRFRLPR